MKINLNEIIDPTEGRIAITVDAAGHKHARFDLQGLPRVEGLLVGKPATAALQMTEHLCGICPVAHHLAGTRALDQLVEMSQLDTRAMLVRRLLHYGSIVETHSLRFVTVDREAGIALKKFSKQMLLAAGSPGHFPITACPGGVKSWPHREDLQILAKELEFAIVATKRVALTLQAGEVSENTLPEIEMADVALIDAEGRPDVFGTRVRIARNNKILDEFDFEQWNEKIAEEIPGDPAPRPYIVTLGTESGRYRVGPVAQLSVGSLSTPQAAQLQSRWLEGSRNAATARAIVTLHVLENTAKVVRELLFAADSFPPNSDTSQSLHWKPGVATGLVDGPRGILAHTYEIDASGDITRAVILTPTAQNEPWLAALLSAAATYDISETKREAALEDSIREADPCLPISSALPGQMGIKLDIIETQ